MCRGDGRAVREVERAVPRKADEPPDTAMGSVKAADGEGRMAGYL